MNDASSTKKSSTPSKSTRAGRARKRKAPAEDGVEAQLAGREASGEAAKGIKYDGTSHETIAAETASIEKVDVLPVESAKTTETADEPAFRANRKMMGKLRRAFRKAGKSEASETEVIAFLTSLLKANVPILNRSSERIARVVKGERSIESLLLARVPTKSA